MKLIRELGPLAIVVVLFGALIGGFCSAKLVIGLGIDAVLLFVALQRVWGPG